MVGSPVLSYSGVERQFVLTVPAGQLLNELETNYLNRLLEDRLLVEVTQPEQPEQPAPVSHGTSRELLRCHGMIIQGKLIADGNLSQPVRPQP